MIIYEHTFPIWLMVVMMLIAVGTAAFTFWLYMPRDNHKIWIIAGGYLAFLGLLTWCMLLPGRKTEETRTLKPRFVVAIDTSSSMLLAPSEDAPKRWDIVQQALDMPWLESVAAECEIDLYKSRTGFDQRWRRRSQ